MTRKGNVEAAQPRLFEESLPGIVVKKVQPVQERELPHYLSRHERERLPILAKVNEDYARQAELYGISVAELKSIFENPKIKPAQVFWLMAHEEKSLAEALADKRSQVTE